MNFIDRKKEIEALNKEYKKREQLCYFIWKKKSRKDNFDKRVYKG